MRFSVVVPLFNKAKYISRAVQSVLTQTLSDFELIVVDDGSSDGGTQIVASILDPRLRLICQENAGKSAARNRGIAEASSEIIAFLDADDEWKPSFLGTICRLIEKCPSCGAYSTALEVIETSGHLWRPVYKGILPPPWEGIIPNYFQSSLGFPPVSSSSSAVWKKCLSLVGGFPEGERLGEDLDTWCRIALKYPIGFSTQVCSIYHREASGRACTNHPVGYEYRLIRTLNNAGKLGRLPPWISTDDILEYRNDMLIESAAACVLSGQGRKARERLRAASSTRLMKNRLLLWYLLSFIPHVFLNTATKVKKIV